MRTAQSNRNLDAYIPTIKKIISIWNKKGIPAQLGSPSSANAHLIFTENQLLFWWVFLNLQCVKPSCEKGNHGNHPKHLSVIKNGVKLYKNCILEVRIDLKQRSGKLSRDFRSKTFI